MADYIPLIERVSNKTFNSIDDTDLVLIPDSSYENFDAVRLIDIKKYILDGYQLNILGVEGNVVKLGANKKLVDSGFTLGTSVPADAKFTDTIYDDTELKEKISNVQNGLTELDTRISYDLSVVDNRSSVNAANIGVLNNQLDEINSNVSGNKSLLYRGFQIIKPFSDRNIFVRLQFSDSSSFSNYKELDSRLNPGVFKALFKSEDSVIWNNIQSSGFGIEYNNMPVYVQSMDFINTNFGSAVDENRIIYVRYLWYYIDSDNKEVRSDQYSLILPSSTEVGANSQDYVSKKELDSRLSDFVSKSQMTDIKIVNELPEDAEDYPNTIFIVVDSE